MNELRARPLWRTFDTPWIARAAEHCRAGGIAALRGSPRWTVLFPCDAEGAMTELVAWAALDLRIKGFDEVTEGPARGLLTAELPPAAQRVVEHWCERDGVFPGHTRAVRFDCHECGVCCRQNRVVMEPEDFARWKEHGRRDFISAEHLRRAGGKMLLRVLDDGGCVFLRGNDCGIYALRPNNCRAFPMGGEGCLTSREEAGLALDDPSLNGG